MQTGAAGEIRQASLSTGLFARPRKLRGTEGQGWNVINNDNEVFCLGDIHLHLFRPTEERCPRVVKGNPLRARFLYLGVSFYHLLPVQSLPNVSEILSL